MKNEIIQKHSKVLLAGVLHALKGAGAFAFLAAAAALFYCVAIDQGYTAVGKFAAAVLCVGIALVLFYCCGRDLMKGTFSK